MLPFKPEYAKGMDGAPDIPGWVENAVSFVEGSGFLSPRSDCIDIVLAAVSLSESERHMLRDLEYVIRQLQIAAANIKSEIIRKERA